MLGSFGGGGGGGWETNLGIERLLVEPLGAQTIFKIIAGQSSYAYVTCTYTL